MDKYVHMTILHEVEPYMNPTSNAKVKRYLCQCDCGKQKIARMDNLKNGHTKSCGCTRVHGMAHSKVYKVYQGMIGRCSYESNTNYERYGGRGITVCDRWKESFTNFWLDMKDTYKPGLTLDRMDVNGNYEPSNCKWSTYSEQNSNRRSKYMITFRGQTKTALQWSRELDVDYHRIIRRLTSGWDHEKILTQPSRNKHKID